MNLNRFGGGAKMKLQNCSHSFPKRQNVILIQEVITHMARLCFMNYHSLLLEIPNFQIQACILVLSRLYKTKDSIQTQIQPQITSIIHRKLNFKNPNQRLNKNINYSAQIKNTIALFKIPEGTEHNAFQNCRFQLLALI